MTVKPLSPDQVQQEKILSFPDEVIEVFNALIIENWNGHSATVLQDEAVSRISAALGISREATFRFHYLDVESLYRAEGWEVKYDNSEYNETHSAFFVFKKPEGGHA